MHTKMKKTLYFLPFLLIISIFLISRGTFLRADIEISEASLITKAIMAVQRDYIERKRIVPRQMLEGALDQIQRKIPEILTTFDDNKAVTVTVEIASKRFSIGGLKSLGDLRDKMQEILSFIDEHYHGDTKKIEIEYAAVDGMLSSLDPHSAFLSPEIYREFKVGTKGEFGGLGIVISVKDGYLTVIAPLDDTPAAKAGIKAGDKIMQIGDESTINMSLTDAVNKLRGKIGTKIKIVIERPGRAEPLTVTLTRALINIDSVQHEIIPRGGKRYGYLKVKNFQSNTDEEVGSAMKDFFGGETKIDGLILDMRNNPGGLLNQAIDLADLFLAKGIIVSTVGRDGIVLESDRAGKDQTDSGYPIAVLINEGSASASEIVAGAIKELGRGIIIGRRSFGKGSVQAIFDIGSDSAIKLTIAKYLPAGTYPIQSVGLAPDVELIPIRIDPKNMDLLEDTIVSERDLEKHFEDEGRIDNPVYRLKYVLPKEEEDEEKLSLQEYSKKPVLKDDFAVEFALRALEASKSTERKSMLENINGVVLETNGQQENEIAAKLKTLGIDWSSGKTKGTPQLKVGFNILKGKNQLKEIRAGGEAALELQATNIGNGTFYKLIGVGKSDSPLLTDKEFVFGKLAPGETRSWQVPIKTPEALPSEELSMKVNFQDDQQSVPASIDAIVPIKEKKLPRFGFSYKLRGQKIKTGSKINLDVEIKNIGEGASDKDAVALLSNKSGEKLFIEVGRLPVGSLAPGAVKRAAFRFHLAPDFNEKNIELEMMIMDASRITSVARKISIDTETAAIKPPAGKFYQPPDIELEPHPVRTADSAWRVKGIVRASEGVRDYFVFVGSKKVAYIPNLSHASEAAIDLSVPLSPGNNIIMVAARDMNDLMGKALLAINRTSGKKEEKSLPDLLPLIPDMMQ
jgi:carboxyl-terminal processing protease